MSLKGAFSTYVTFISYKLGWLYEFYLHLGIMILTKNIKPLYIYINKALILTVHSLKLNDQQKILSIYLWNISSVNLLQVHCEPPSQREMHTDEEPVTFATILEPQKLISNANNTSYE